MAAKIVTTTKGKSLDFSRLKLKNQSVIPVSNKLKVPPVQEEATEIPVESAPKLRTRTVVNAPVTEIESKVEEKPKGKK